MSVNINIKSVFTATENFFSLPYNGYDANIDTVYNVIHNTLKE